MGERLTWRDDTRRLGDLVPWPRNPRDIDTVQAERLRESLDEFDQPLPIAIGPDGEVYDGHQRLKAWIEERGPDFEVAVRVSSRALTEAEREKLTVMLHKGAVGDWDWEELATWDAGKLVDWGFESWEIGASSKGDDPNELWEGMPEFEQDDLSPYQSIKVHFASSKDRESFAALVNQTLTENTKSIWYPKAEIRTFMDKRYTERES
jgi:hypothetical protein